jgi:putative hemolysin
LKKYRKIGIILGIIVAITMVLLIVPLAKNVEVESGNVASKYCIEHGGSSFIMTTQTVSGELMEQGICELPDGTQCEEWSYYRGECEVIKKP